MKTIEQIVDAIKNKQTWERDNNDVLDRRDLNRLAQYLNLQQLEEVGYVLKNAETKWKVAPFTEESVLYELKDDLDFAFEKAVNRRGISSNLMYEVIKMWMWILEDDLVSFDGYDPYGIPLYKKVAKKYSLPDRSGEYFEK